MQRSLAQKTMSSTARSAFRADMAAALDPARLMKAAGLTPDPWQARFLRTPARRTLLLITRQGGKSTTTAAKALHKALYHPKSLVLLLSPAQRQSGEIFAKVVSLYRAAGEPVPTTKLSALHMHLENGSRIQALPGTEKTVRGFSGVDLLIIGEASRVDDGLYYSVRPMLAVSGGELVALTTPWGKRGFFYHEWTGADASGLGEGWQKIRVTARDCPRISEAFLEEERRKMPTNWFRSEYLCAFTDTVDAAFATEDINAAFSAGEAGEVSPLFQSEAGAARAGGLFGAPSDSEIIHPLDLGP